LNWRSAVANARSWTPGAALRVLLQHGVRRHEEERAEHREHAEQAEFSDDPPTRAVGEAGDAERLGRGCCGRRGVQVERGAVGPIEPIGTMPIYTLRAESRSRSSKPTGTPARDWQVGQHKQAAPEVGEPARVDGPEPRSWLGRDDHQAVLQQVVVERT
jgi:hypothetical protein